MDKLKRLKELYRFYATNPFPSDFEKKLEGELGVKLQTSYGEAPLKNPILVAPGQLTKNVGQIRKIFNAGYGGCILKSVVGEAESGDASMIALRKKTTFIRSFYEPDDKEGRYPIIHWDGGADVRSLDEYLVFATDARKIAPKGFFIGASILCHLPSAEEGFKEEEWSHSVGEIYRSGYQYIEIDFCPQLELQTDARSRENVLRWYREVPLLIKSAFPQVKIFPKLINPLWGIDFQVRMAEEAIKGGADGLVVANRFYKEEYRSAHGGRELKILNLAQLKEIKKRFPHLNISATGGVYSGKDVFEYLQAGADNVQLLSFIMGKVRTPFNKQGNKFEKVLHQLLLDPEEGLLATMITET